MPKFGMTLRKLRIQFQRPGDGSKRLRKNLMRRPAAKDGVNGIAIGQTRVRQRERGITHHGALQIAERQFETAATWPGQARPSRHVELVSLCILRGMTA